MALTHGQLCIKARVWLRGTRRCRPVFSQCASCTEIPDAIGWSTRHGSTVVECKTSISDFYADQKKRLAWKSKEHGWTLPYRCIEQDDKYEEIELPRMGDFRFYLCEAGVLTKERVSVVAPDHGLLWVTGKIIRVVKDAPKREVVDKDSEIRYLRFAIINKKDPDFEEAEVSVPQLFEASTTEAK
jgi:hypothetical protein